MKILTMVIARIRIVALIYVAFVGSLAHGKEAVDLTSITFAAIQLQSQDVGNFATLKALASQAKSLGAE